jgi:hypothetical protein
MSPDGKKTNALLYVSQTQGTTGGLVDVFSVPKYSLVGQITDGIDHPQGLAVDKHGNLYVANLNPDTDTVTVYKPRETSPFRTLTGSDGPLDVAVGNNGYVYVGDEGGHVDIYPPGATAPSRRLTNLNLAYVGGVAVSSSNDVYAAGQSPYYSSYYPNSVVVRFTKARGSGKNLRLTAGPSGLLKGMLSGVIVDGNHLIVTAFNYRNGAIFTYVLGQTSPSSKFMVLLPVHPALNKAENKIYAPSTYNHGDTGVYDYPSGKFVTNIQDGDTGAALSPAANL